MRLYQIECANSYFDTLNESIFNKLGNFFDSRRLKKARKEAHKAGKNFSKDNLKEFTKSMGGQPVTFELAKEFIKRQQIDKNVIKIAEEQTRKELGKPPEAHPKPTGEDDNNPKYIKEINGAKRDISVLTDRFREYLNVFFYYIGRELESFSIYNNETSKDNNKEQDTEQGKQKDNKQSQYDDSDGQKTKTISQRRKELKDIVEKIAKEKNIDTNKMKEIRRKLQSGEENLTTDEKEELLKLGVGLLT